MNVISTPNIERAPLYQIMIISARMVTVFGDSPIFIHKNLAYIYKLDRITIAISGVSNEDKMRLEDVSIKVILA